jgi:excisionase family DNA binding protein
VTVATLLTSRDMQELINVDRSTIYRMAETGRIPAIKVGRQWRFPADEIEAWLREQSSGPGRAPQVVDAADFIKSDLRSVLPANAIQSMADLLAEIFGVMVVVTDMEGKPLTEVSNPCRLFAAVQEIPGTVNRCIDGWRELGDQLDLQPRFAPTHFGFLCARSFIRSGNELSGMVIVGGVAPPEWPPSDATVDAIAEDLGIGTEVVADNIHGVWYADAQQQSWILEFLPRIGSLISRMAQERSHLVDKLEAIATLAGAGPSHSTPLENRRSQT